MFNMLNKRNKDNNNEMYLCSLDVISNESVLMNKRNENKIHNEDKCNKRLNEDNKELSFEEHFKKNKRSKFKRN